MAEFLYWGDVQRRLTEHVEQGAAPYSFYDATRELWEEGIYHTAEELPKVSFEDWDVDDLDELERLLDSTPVDMSHFSREFQARLPAKNVIKHAVKLKGDPIRIAVDQAMGTHTHNVFRILYVVRGRAMLKLRMTTHTLQENTICIVPPGLYHDLLPQPGCLLLSIALADQTVEDTLYQQLRQDNAISAFFRSGLGGESCGYLLISLKQPRRIRSIYRDILHECYAKGEYSEDIYISCLRILFALLLRDATGLENHLLSGEHGALAMLSVLRYIQVHYRKTSLNEVAERFHYEPSYLGKLIKSATGKNYTDIIRDLRIAQAKKLLRTTSLTVDEVAEQAGYDSRVHFFRSFRAVVGQTPGEYRKERVEKKKEL